MGNLPSDWCRQLVLYTETFTFTVYKRGIQTFHSFHHLIALILKSSPSRVWNPSVVHTQFVDQLTPVQWNKNVTPARLTVFGTLCVSSSSPPTGIRFPSPFLCAPSVFRVCIRNPPRFPSNPPQVHLLLSLPFAPYTASVHPSILPFLSLCLLFSSSLLLSHSWPPWPLRLWWLIWQYGMGSLDWDECDGFIVSAAL